MELPIKTEKKYWSGFLICESRNMPSDVLTVGFEFISEWKIKNMYFSEWRHSNEEEKYIRLVIKNRIIFILGVLATHGKIDSIDRCVTVVINSSFNKILIQLDPVENYDVTDVLLSISQAFYSIGGWIEGKVDFNSILFSDEICYYITRVTSPKYLDTVNYIPC